VTALAALQVDSLLSYLIAIIIPALDAVFPILPSETAIITLGVATAGSADPRIALLVACCAAGAFLGDNLCYLLGRRFGPRIEGRFFRGEKGRRRLAWAERSLERYGTPLIVVCRFIPGGRTAVMLCCGIVGFPRRRFIIATALAGGIWASYSFFIGRLGGRAFEDKPWAGLLLAFGASIAISALIELIRRIRARTATPGAGDGDIMLPDASGRRTEACSGDRVQLPPALWGVLWGGNCTRRWGCPPGRLLRRGRVRGPWHRLGRAIRGWHGLSYRS
jgi:membrane-associated protein